MASSYYVSVDVGTGSVRAALWDEEGHLHPIKTWSPIKTWINEGMPEGSYEQSTRDIWNSVKTCIKEVVKGVAFPLIKGIGFDATCSLVAVDDGGDPVTISPTHDDDRNVVLWQDHRAIKEAEEINAGKHPVLDCVGGVMSPEMEPPKLLWLRKNLYDECWKRTGHFFDLADYLTYRATGSTVRSLCTLTCKWTYIAHDVEEEEEEGGVEVTSTDTRLRLNKGWNDSFWKSIGLECLVKEGYKRIGTEVQVPGKAVGAGLSAGAAEELGLSPGTPVATGIIDAHAGGVGMLGADTSLIGSLGDVPLTSRLALIGGTSSCHMMSFNTPLLIPGVWGPYYSAMLPSLYLNEGGQSASGALIDHVLQSYPEPYSEIKERAERTQGITSVHQLIASNLESLSRRKGLPSPSHLTSGYHVCPDYHGNRSPLADPTLRGMVSGLSLGRSVDDLSVAYLGTIQALAYNTRHIIEIAESSASKSRAATRGRDSNRLNGDEVVLKALFVCGGLSSNSLFLQTHSDVTGLPVLVLSDERDAVLLGSAILAATASTGESMPSIMSKMSSIDRDKVIYPDKTPSLVRFHESKCKVMKCMYEDQYKYRRIMNGM